MLLNGLRACTWWLRAASEIRDKKPNKSPHQTMGFSVPWRDTLFIAVSAFKDEFIVVALFEFEEFFAGNVAGPVRVSQVSREFCNINKTFSSLKSFVVCPRNLSLQAPLGNVVPSVVEGVHNQIFTETSFWECLFWVMRPYR